MLGRVLGALFESSFARRFSLLISSKEGLTSTEHLLTPLHISNGAAPESDTTDPEAHEVLLESTDFVI
jgi:hypothetical protein